MLPDIPQLSGPVPTAPDSMHIFLDGGMPPQKILLGLTGYGGSFQLVSSQNAGLEAPVTGPGFPGKYKKTPGSLSFYEIYSTNLAHMTPLNESKVGAPYASENNQWVGYETRWSIRHKMTSLINRYDLRGFGFWGLDYDNFTGKFCNLGKYRCYLLPLRQW